MWFQCIGMLMVSCRSESKFSQAIEMSCLLQNMKYTFQLSSLHTYET